ncbi:hypothetical protein NQ317_012360 [Molorchus minor]|uniref:Uncharacterized protein n=1 Tax=Molorchus minor TaxID=1323400 RepID=A0ABQ9J0X4_9CUCU|nr:hypothetical protein NQ317_012360 [Molorchus minor]
MSSLDDLYSSTLLWIEQHCTLVDLRPGNYNKDPTIRQFALAYEFSLLVVLNSLRYVCTKTDILSEPEKLPDEVRQMVLSNKNGNQKS